MTIQDVSPEHAKSFGLTKASGALITTVGKDTPAARYSLEIGDIILKFNGKELTDAGDLARTVADVAPGSIARLRIWRRGAEKEVVATLGDMDADLTTLKPRPLVKGVAPDKIGLTMHELNTDERQMLRTDGYVVVDAVDGYCGRVRPSAK